VRNPRAWLRVCAAVFAIAWGGNEFTPLLVMYRQDDHLSAVTVDGLLAVYVLGIVPAMIVGAPLSDRFGRAPVMRVAPFTAAAGGIVLAAAHGDAALIAIGRVLCGVALGLAMAIGTSWIKELSEPPFAAAARPGLGAARGSLSLTAGLALGAVAAALSAQYAPAPESLPYAFDIALAIAAGIALLGAPETLRALPGRPSLRALIADLAVPAAGHRRFLLVVVPAAPWVFGAASTAYAVLPGLVGAEVAGASVAFSGLMCLVALGTGFAAQPFARRLHSRHSARAVLLALGATVAGMLVAAVTASTLQLAAAIAAAAVLGVAYGLLMLSGMLEVQRIATGRDLAGLTALYYAGTYTGFFAPVVLAALSQWIPYWALFAAGAVLAAGCAGLVASASRRHLHPHGIALHGERIEAEAADEAA